MSSASLWAYSAEKLFLMIAKQPDLRVWLFCFFTGKGRGGKRHLLLLVSFGNSRKAIKLCYCPYVSSRKRLQIGATQKIL
jgi:hypothetical protein